MNSNVLRSLRVFAILFAILLSLMLVSCEEDGASLIISSDTYVVKAGDTVDIEQLKELYLTDTIEPEDTTKPEPIESDPIESTAEIITQIPIPPPADTDVAGGEDEDDASVVYWVKGGEVWHIKRTCSTLSRSKTILSGSVEEAIAAGKGRVCKRCGG